MAKWLQPDAEERQFCDRMNKLIDRYGATVTACSRIDEQSGRQIYMLTFAKGTKRYPLQSELPWSWTGEEETLHIAKNWLEGNVGGDAWFNRWSPDPKYAD